MAIGVSGEDTHLTVRGIENGRAEIFIQLTGLRCFGHEQGEKTKKELVFF